MVVEFVFPISFLVLSMLLVFESSTAATAPIAKPNCTDHCGNIKIPYPFGIGKDCYINEWFEISCKESAYPAKAFIRKINLEVVNFNRGIVLVKTPIVSNNCSGKAPAGPPVNLTGSPFYFPFTNMFTAVGCNARALLIGPQIIGCDLTCSTNKTTVADDAQRNNFCSGNNCCQASIPFQYWLQVLNPSLEAKNESQDGKGCTRAFVAHRTWFFTVVNNPEVLQVLENVRTALAWKLDNSSWKYDDRIMYCDYIIYDSLTDFRVFQCICGNGYMGNPYLECIDINECEDPKQHSCRGMLKCVNVPGSYECKVNANWIIVLVLGGIFMLSLLFMGGGWLCKFARRRRDFENKKKFLKSNGGLLLQQQLSSSHESGVQKTLVFTSKELEKATDGFNRNRILGQGGQGDEPLITHKTW